MIKVFGATDKVFLSNGDIVIKPLKAVVHNEDNGEYYLTLETAAEYADYMVGGNIIVAPTPQGDQAFRISNPQITNRRISLKAYHVYYDAINYLIYDSYVVNKNCSDALAHLNAATDTQSPFTVGSDVQTVDSYRCVRSSLQEAVKTVLDRWGGHLIRNNWSIYIAASIANDNGVTVRYGKNLKSITCEYNWDNVVTKLLPTGANGIMLNELDSSADPYIYANIIYPIPYTKTVAFTQDIKQEDYSDDTAYKTALITDLRAQAEAYVALHKVPEVSYTLDAHLDHVTDIGDVISVVDERLGIDLITSVTAYDYDCIQKRFIELQFGNFIPRKLSGLLSTIDAAVNRQISLNAAITVATAQSSTDYSDRLRAGADLDAYKMTRTYYGYAEDGILNCPVSTGYFTLDVSALSDTGYIKQTVTAINKTYPQTFTRAYYGGSWGSWI